MLPWTGAMENNPTVNEWVMRRCKELESTVKSLQREIRVLKSHDRKTKRQLRIDYDWDGEEANLSDKVSNWVKEYLFPRYKFLKDGWMEYSDGSESLSSFVQRKMKMEEELDFKGQWERVICSTIQNKYVTVRCNLNNEVRKAYKCKSRREVYCFYLHSKSHSNVYRPLNHCKNRRSQ
jgi:hypothetical protein